jgi:hypothetical protein
LNEPRLRNDEQPNNILPKNFTNIPNANNNIAYNSQQVYSNVAFNNQGYGINNNQYVNDEGLYYNDTVGGYINSPNVYNNNNILTNPNCNLVNMQYIPQQLNFIHPMPINQFPQTYMPVEGNRIKSTIMGNQMVDYGQNYMTSVGGNYFVQTNQPIMNSNNMMIPNINIRNPTISSSQNNLLNNMNNRKNNNQNNNNQNNNNLRINTKRQQIPIKNVISNNQHVRGNNIIPNNNLGKDFSAMNLNNNINKNNTNLNSIKRNPMGKHENQGFKNRELNFQQKNLEYYEDNYYEEPIVNPKKDKRENPKSKKSHPLLTNLKNMPNFLDLTNDELCRYAYVLSKDQAGCRFLQKKIEEDVDLADNIFLTVNLT